MDDQLNSELECVDTSVGERILNLESPALDTSERELLEAHKAERLLARLRFAKRAHKRDREYQFWQEGAHAEMIFSEPVMREKLDYIHRNPVKRGYVDIPEHWRYSSARNYLGEPGLIGVDPWS